MVTRWLIVLIVLLTSFSAWAWEEEQALEFIFAYNPLIRAQQTLTKEYALPTTGRWLLEHTTVFARSSTGTSTSVSENGDTTTTSPSTIGIQINIPLSSPKERREMAEKSLQEAAKLDEIRRQVITDMAQLRTHEADLLAAKQRWKFFKDKSDDIEDRIKKGLEGDINVFWDNTQKLNTEGADIMRLEHLIAAQRQLVARYAGDEWRKLLAYLEGKGKLP